MFRSIRTAFHAALDPYRLLLMVAMAIYIVIFAGLAFDLHNGMRTHRADLGQIAQAVWNSSRGRFVEMTDNGFVASRLTDHVEPILALISPILWLWEDVKALLLLQVVMVAIGAWLLYELALRRLDTLLTPRERQQIWQSEPLRQLTRPLALSLAAAYLLAPQLQSALLTEFHAAPLAVPFVLWAFGAIDAERPWQMASAIVLVALVKEEMALLAAGLALWGCWRFYLAQWRAEQIHAVRPVLATAAAQLPPRLKRSVRLTRNMGLSLVLFALALLWFYVATFLIVPAHAAQVYASDQSVYFERYGALGDSPLDIAKSFVTQPSVLWQIASEPARLQYLWRLLVPFGLLSLLAPEILLLALPLLLANLLSAYPAQYYGDFHYSAPLIPYVAVGAVYGLARLWRWSGRRTNAHSANYQHMAAASTTVMAFTSFFTNARTALRPLITLFLALWILTWAAIGYLALGRGPWGGHYDPPSTSTVAHTHQRLLPYFLAQIPRDAAVTATAAVHPHLSLRRYVYQFPLGLPELGKAGNADWALLDVTTNTDMAPGDLKNGVDTLLAGEWGVVDGADGFLLLHRGAPVKAIPAAFYDFARTTDAVDGQQTQVKLAKTELVQATATEWARWREIKVSAEWLVGSKGGEPFAPRLDLVTPSGETLYTLMTAAPPALVWYPPVRWQPGERIRVTTLPLWLPRFWGMVTDSAAVAPTLALMASDEGQQSLVNLLQQGTVGLAEIPFPAGTPPFDNAQLLNPAAATFQDSQGNPLLSLRAWGDTTTMTPGTTFRVWLRWRGTMWPAQQSVFVHLRVNGENVAQQDGVPRFFLYSDVGAQLAKRGVIEDFREVVVPQSLPLGEVVTVVIGLYDWESGARLAVTDQAGQAQGDEWRVGQFRVVPPPVPDQACAMIAASCTTQ